MDRPYKAIISEYQAVVRDQLERMAAGDAFGDTPIERLLYCAIWAEAKYSVNSFFALLPASDSRYPVNDLMALDAARMSIVIEKQKQLDGWRVDFLLSVFRFNRDKNVAGEWRSLIIECDGHDFHERTPEQAARDRKRDREFQAKGYTVFRFTGTEIWRDPVKCAVSVIKWAEDARL